MWSRAFFLSVTAFFVIMNVLLWRAEIAGRNKIGSPVPVETVWRKMITAPDLSSLEIRHRGKKIGFCRWIPSIGERNQTEALQRGEVPEGMVKETIGYDIDLNGNVALDEQNRLRFSFDLRLSTNSAWQDVALRLNLRPSQWEIHSAASDQKIRFVSDDGIQRHDRVFTFKDLKKPEKILREIGGPMLPGLLGLLGLPLDVNQLTSEASHFKWEARNDWLTMGNARIRVYRLRFSLLDRYEMSVLVSRVGEILRVELPDDILLINEALISF